MPVPLFAHFWCWVWLLCVAWGGLFVSVGVICLLLESVFPVTGERSFCYGRAFFLLREADFSVGRIDFSTSRRCFSAFAQVHLSPLTSVFVYSHKCFYVFSQVFFCAPTSASRSLHEQLACMQAGLLPRPTLPCCGTVWWYCQVLKKRYRNLYVRISIPLIERLCAICWL